MINDREKVEKVKIDIEESEEVIEPTNEPQPSLCARRMFLLLLRNWILLPFFGRSSNIGFELKGNLGQPGISFYIPCNLLLPFIVHDMRPKCRRRPSYPEPEPVVADINFNIRIPLVWFQLWRYSFRRKIWTGVLVGLFVALLTDSIRLIINEALLVDTTPANEDSYEAYDSAGFRDHFEPELPLVLSRDRVVRLREDETRTEPDSRNGTGNGSEAKQGISIAEELAGRVRVLCWVLTNPRSHHTRAIHIKRTWGKRCNILLFMSTGNDSVLGTTVLNVAEGRMHLWTKTKEAFRYVYKHYRDEADWFLKVDDDTYVIVENLRAFLQHQFPEEPVYFGSRFRPYVRQGYMSGGAGYVLSKSAVKLLVTQGLDGELWSCPNTTRTGIEDVEMGRCLQSLGVIAGDSRVGSSGSYRFLPLSLEMHVNPFAMPRRSWYFRYIYYPQPKGLRCCSDSAVSFHYVKPSAMYYMDYLIYRHKVKSD